MQIHEGRVLAVVALLLIIIIALGIACWVIASKDRSDRVARLILARHGNAKCLQPPSAKGRQRGSVAPG